MTTAAHLAETIAQAGLLVLLGPLVTGFIQKVKARLQCRQGASLWQPYRDLAKLLRKGTVQSDSASPFFRAVPVLVLAATLTTTTMLPVLWAGAGPAALPLGDAILLLALLALARFLCAIGALDAGGAFGGMGASREMTVGLLVEPALMMAVFSVSVAGGTTDLGDLAVRRGVLPALAWQAPDLLALFAMLVLALAETGRIPVDNPDTHLELTMLHEGMLLEHSGPGLACIVLATHTKQLVILTLVAALFFPLGLAPGLAPADIAFALAAFAAKVLALALFLALVESSYAKLRFFRVPQFLGLGLVCAFLALALRILMSAVLAVRLINVLGALLLFTMLLILAAGQLYRAIYAVAAQAVLLGIAGGVLGAATGNIDLWVIAGITIVVKAILLPWLLIRVVKRINIGRDIEPVIPINVTLLFAAAIVVLAFHLSASLGSVRQAITGNALPVGIALILLGVLVMASRRKALVQMVGLFASENGIFFTAMAISQGMPLIIEIGVILDVVLGALVMGILVLRVRSSVDTDIADLESLKG